MRKLLVVIGLALVATACGSGGSATTGLRFPPTTSTPDSSTITASTGTATTITTSVPPATTTTTTTVPPITVAAGDIPVAAVVTTVEAQYQARWDYYRPDKPLGIVGPVEIECDHEDDVGFGAVLLCEATPVEEREYWPDPFPITILVTGENGTVTSSSDGRFEAAYQAVGVGRFCRDLIASETPFSSYYGAVSYWFLEGQPDRMDADRDGIPCETVFPLWDIAGFWHATPREEATGIHFGIVTDVASIGSDFELTIDYAFFLGGLEADLAAEAAGEIQPGEGVPNDYFIVNENPRLRTFQLADGLQPLLVGYRDGIETIAVKPLVWMGMVAEAERCEAAGWPDDCATLGGDDWSWMGSGWLPYWIQLEGDTVIRIEEQYLP